MVLIKFRGVFHFSPRNNPNKNHPLMGSALNLISTISQSRGQAAPQQEVFPKLPGGETQTIN
jgi:hypothetical protein